MMVSNRYNFSIQPGVGSGDHLLIHDWIRNVELTVELDSFRNLVNLCFVQSNGEYHFNLGEISLEQ